MTKLRAIVVDDEPLARDELNFLLGQCEGVEVIAQVGDSETALERVRALNPDVAFVDLRMPGPDGISFAQAVFESHPHLHVIIVSAHQDGALRAFDARVADYLLKPVRLDRLQNAVRRLHDRVTSVTTQTSGAISRLAVKRGSAYVILNIDDVIYFEMQDELVWAVTDTDRYALDFSLSHLEQNLPSNAFFRSHRGVLVALQRIAAIEPSGQSTYELVLDHPAKPRVPLARERVRQLRQCIPFTG